MYIDKRTRTIHGLGSELPAPGSPSLRIGSIFEASDSSARVRLGAPGGVRSWLPALAMASLTIYADPNGSALAFGLDPAHPTTLAAAVAMAAAGLALNVVCAPGNYASWPWPNGGRLPPGSYVNLQGSYATVFAGNLGAGSANVLLDSGVANLVVNAYRGARIRFTAGTMAGRYFTVRSNDATNFTVFGQIGVWTPAPGDAYVIERPASVFVIGATAPIPPMYIDGAVVRIAGFKHTSTTGIRPGFNGKGSLFMEGLEFDGTNGQIAGIFSTYGVQAYVGTPVTVISAVGNPTASEHGCYWHNNGVTNGTNYFATNFCHTTIYNLIADGAWMPHYYGCQVSCFGYDTTGFSFHLLEQSRIYLFSPNDLSSTAVSTMVGKAASIAFAAVDLTLGSIGDFETGSISNVAGGPAVYVGDGCLGFFWGAASGRSGIVGTGNGTYGVVAVNGGRVGAHGTPTLTGAAGDVLLGGNAAPTTWAQIAAGSKSDLASATPQGCFAAPAQT
jgi:hypothetical protein